MQGCLIKALEQKVNLKQHPVWVGVGVCVVGGGVCVGVGGGGSGGLTRCKYHKLLNSLLDQRLLHPCPKSSSEYHHHGELLLPSNFLIFVVAA